MNSVQQQRLTAIGLAVLGLGLMLANHFYGHRSYLDNLNTAHTLHMPVTHGSPVDSSPPALARRVWVLVLDGLRDDFADSLPAVRRLSRIGCRRRLLAEFPTFTFPNLTAMSTGVPPFYSGVRLNEGPPGVPIESLFDVAKRVGLPTALVADWKDFPQALDRKNAGLLARQRLEMAEFLARTPERELAWIHFDEIDRAGHRYGARSAEYLTAVRDGDVLLGELADRLDLNRDALIALSDHGHRDRGGHGAIEPEVEAAFFLAVGAHINSGTRLPARPMRDVASTLAALVGISPPRDNYGAPMLDVLGLAPEQAARTLAPAFAQRSAIDADATTAEPARRITEALNAGQAGATSLAIAWLQQRSAARMAAIAHTMQSRREQRLFWASCVALGCMGGLALAYRRNWLRPQLRDLLPLVAYLLVFLGLYLACGYSLSWSVPRGSVSFMVETAGMGLVAAFAAAAVRRCSVVGGQRSLEQASALLPMWILYILVVAAAGHDPAYLESPRLSFLLVFLSTIEFYASGLFVCLALSSLHPGSHRRQT